LTSNGKDQAVNKVSDAFAHAVEELGRVAPHLDEDQIDRLIDAIAKAKRVFCIGVGREGLSTRALTMRLMHLGKEAHWIWDDTTPAIGPGDLFIATSGSGEIGHIDYVFDRAAAAGAATAVVTGDPSGRTARKAQTLLWLPAAVYNGKAVVVPSIQPMGNLFEQALLILFDQIVIALAERLGVDRAAMSARHRNVE
jgi:6-phospho-3-hexuloisomerase